MLNLREIGLRHNPSFIRNIGAGFEPLDASFQGIAIDHPPDKDGQRRGESGKKQQGIGRSINHTIA